tara:strand:- start:884 stop:1390 length:507 start_codon:yes stop_codon:yes gene_type:complete
MPLLFCLILFPIIILANSFPEISGKTLSDKPIEIPSQTTHQLLILGFDMKSAKSMEAWVRGLDLVPSPNISWVQIPIIGSVPPFVDGFIKGGMKKSMPIEVQDTFFPYFGNKKFDILKSIQGSESLTDNVTPFIVMTHPSGNIQFSNQMAATTQNIELIKKRIQLIKP